MKNITHLSKKGDPIMVDVGDKKISKRLAIAKSLVHLPGEVLLSLQRDNFNTKKGAIFQTAILAGIMGVKKTSDLIPLCHPLPLNKVNVDIELNNDNQIEITCTVGVEGKTGVEMEALTGASIAALTIYDMCKALSHDVKIIETKLIQKTGGKSDYEAS